MDPHQETNHTEYVLGFAFNEFNDVYLIEKLKPEWQRGKLNGVGGKIEPGETPRNAMVREFFEETGVVIARDDWHAFFVMQFGNGAIVHCFTAWIPPGESPQTMESEKVTCVTWSMLCDLWSYESATIDNLRFLVPMAWHELVRPLHERMVVR